jgi:hypothetical protein
MRFQNSETVIIVKREALDEVTWSNGSGDENENRNRRVSRTADKSALQMTECFDHVGPIP